MQGWHTPYLGLRELPREFGQFELQAFFTFGRAELELIDKPRRNFILKDALAEYSAHGGSEFSYVLIDCPPSLSVTTINAMVASNAVLVPLQCEFLAMEGLSQILRTIELVRAGLNPDLEIQGVVLTMFDKRNNLSDQVAGELRRMASGLPAHVEEADLISYGLVGLISAIQRFEELMADPDSPIRAIRRGGSSWSMSRPSDP